MFFSRTFQIDPFAALLVSTLEKKSDVDVVRVDPTHLHSVHMRCIRRAKIRDIDESKGDQARARDPPGPLLSAADFALRRSASYEDQHHPNDKRSSMIGDSSAIRFSTSAEPVPGQVIVLPSSDRYRLRAPVHSAVPSQSPTKDFIRSNASAAFFFLCAENATDRQTNRKEGKKRLVHG